MTTLIQAPTRRRIGFRGDPDIPWDSQAELDLLRDLCRKDFWTFFLYAFGAWTNPRGKRWIEPEVHRPLAEWFQAHVDEWMADRESGRGHQKHLAILMHREVGKTTMITRAGQLWLHLRDPEFSSYTGSEKSELSIKMLRAMKAVMDGTDQDSLWAKLYGNWATSATTWTGKEIVHAGRRNTSRQDPSFGVFAVETSITGAHPDAIFYDDPISYERLITDTNWMKTVNEQVSSLFPTYQSDAIIVWVGTRYGDDDHFGLAFDAERGDGIASLSGMETDSMKIDPNGLWHVYFMAGRDKTGKPTTPKVWNDARLSRYQRRDPTKYAAQIMNDPSISEHNPITREQIEQCAIEPKDVPWPALRYALMTDLALWDGKSRVAKDETVYIVHGYARDGSGDVYIIEGDGSPMWRGEDFKNRLVALCQRYRRMGRKIFRVTGDLSMAGLKGVWANDLANAFNDANEPFPGGKLLEFSRGGQKKIQRIVAAAHFWVDGHVKWVRGAKGVDRLTEQMAKIGQMMVNPKLKDDWADAHSDAFQPELYSPMRQNEPRRSGYDRGATAIRTDGLDPYDYGYDETRQWYDECPRPPLRQGE